MKYQGICIIGAGYMAKEYLKVLKSKKIICDGIFSRTKIKCINLKKKFNIKKIYNSIDEINSCNKIKYLIIAVNEISVFEIVKKLKLNKYIILCEKPVGINLNESIKIFKILKKKQKNFFVALNRRFYSSTIKAKKLVENFPGKRFLQINDQQFQRSKNSIINKNYMYCNSVHLIDYINFFIRGRIKKVKYINQMKYKKFSKTIVQMTFTSGDEVIYHCVWNGPGAWSINIYQKKQRCELKPLEVLNYEKIHKYNLKRKIFRKTANDINFKPGINIMVKEFLKSIKKKSHQLTSFEDYLKTVKIIKKIYV